jgi:hypothetical protein
MAIVAGASGTRRDNPGGDAVIIHYHILQLILDINVVRIFRPNITDRIERHGSRGGTPGYLVGGSLARCFWGTRPQMKCPQRRRVNNYRLII